MKLLSDEMLLEVYRKLLQEKDFTQEYVQLIKNELERRNLAY